MIRPTLKSTDRPLPDRELWAFDTEDDSRGNVRQISLYNGETFYHFTNRNDFRNHLYTIRRPIYITATNLEYDILNTFGDRMDLLNIRFKAAGSVIVSAQLRGTRVRFYDSLNHSPLGVASLGEYVGKPKLKMDLSGWDYVDRDTEITLLFMQSLRESYERVGAGLYATLPGTAMDLYRRKFLPFQVTQPSPNALQFMFNGYSGGRVEVFNTKPQMGRLFYIDVNSMYPAVMRNGFPNPNENRFVERLPDNGWGFADCTVRIPRDDAFPILPHRGKRLIFPTGNFRGTWTFPELWKALEHGTKIVKVHRVLRFATSCDPFSAYVDYLYPLKKNASSEIDRYTAKILLNSLYGKFGERVEEVQLLPIDRVPRNKAAICYGDYAIVHFGEKFPNHTNVVWSAYTTAYARIQLTNALRELHAKGAMVLYCDTDSIIYKADSALHIESNELGGWRLEGMYSFAHFLAPKLYALEGDGKRYVRAKGVPKIAAPRFFDEGTVTFSRPLRLRTVLAKGLTGTYWEKFRKSRLTGYTKRVILPDGSTRPHHLRMGGVK